MGIRIRLNIFTAIKVGYILVTGIKEAAEDNQITWEESQLIMQKVLKQLGIGILGVADDKEWTKKVHAFNFNQGDK